MAQAARSENGRPELSVREQELVHKLGDRSMALFFVGFIAFLELLVIFQLTHPGGRF